MNKDVQQLVRNIEHINGVEVRTNGAGHYAVYKDGKIVTTLPTSPSDPRWRQNALTKLRAVGITPSVRPSKPAKEPIQMLSVEELRKRAQALEIKADFCRFIVDDMPKLHPKMRTYKNFDSATASMNEFIHERSGLLDWTHLLLDQAFRDWDSLRAQVARMKEEPEPEVVPEPEPRKMTKSEAAALGGQTAAANRRRRQMERQQAQALEQAAKVLPPEPNGLRGQYAEALLEILRIEGSDTNERILDRLDKLVGA